MTDARDRLLEFTRGFADAVKTLDVPHIHPCGGIFVHERREMFDAAARGDTREVSCLTDLIDARIAQEREWLEEAV